MSSHIADHFDPVGYGEGCAVAAAAALTGAILVPAVPLRVGLFTLTGLLWGPVYPMIMTVAGRLHPNRVAAVTGGLATAAIFGSLLYPPLVGLISVRIGLLVGMLGLVVLGAVGAIALFAVRPAHHTAPSSFSPPDVVP